MSSNRILQVITRSDWGGAPRIVQSLATQVEDVKAVACGPGGRLINRLRKEGVKVHVQPSLRSSPNIQDIQAYRDIYNVIVDGDFDLVHSHSTKAGALARIAALQADIPSIFTVHGWGFYNNDYRALKPLVISGEKFLASHTDEIVCVSNNDLQKGKEQRILGQNSGKVIHNGISPKYTPSSQKVLHKELEIPHKTPIIGAISRLASQKNPLGILETARRLRNRGHVFATVLIGTGPLAEKCQSFVDKHDLNNVYLLGFREDAMELLPEFDVFLLPSRFEGFPLTVLECLHFGVPLVANDTGGVAEAIDNGITGFVVSSDADKVFVDKVEELMENEDVRNNMSYRAQQIATTQFTEERMVRNYIELYNNILGR